jgi:hypothetical protein
MRIMTEIRVPKALALGRLGPSAYRLFRAAPGRLQARPDPRAPSSARASFERTQPDAEDIEQAVRERLYGARSGSR